eukprot:gene804-999_t
MDILSKHNKLINDYKHYFPSSSTSTTTATKTTTTNNDKYKNFKTDYELLKQEHRFIRDDDEPDLDDSNRTSPSGASSMTWEKRIAKRYYDKLYKEYAIIDLSQYKKGMVGLRWRIESEVVSGRGQFTCANRKCLLKDQLKAYEVPFTYIEDQSGEKTALVKVVLCYGCSKLLHYTNIKKKKKELKQFLKQQEKEKEKQNKKRKYINDDDDDGDGDDDRLESYDEEISYNENGERERKKIAKTSHQSEEQTSNNNNNKKEPNPLDSSQVKNPVNKKSKDEDDEDEMDHYFEGLFPPSSTLSS